MIEVFYTILGLVVGSFGTLAPKFLLSSPCANCDSDASLHAPIAAATCVFLGQTLCLMVPFSQSKRLHLSDARLLLLPSFLAFTSTAFQISSLIFLPASLLAGLRGFLILWTAQLSSYLGLKDSPSSLWEWRCVYVCFVGTLLVGLCPVLDLLVLSQSVVAGDEEGSGAVSVVGGQGLAFTLGITFAALGYALASAQVCVEQIALGKFSRWEVLGVEGVIGSLISFVFIVRINI